jgi:hypothetical protein
MLRRMARSQEGGQRREARAKPEAGQGSEVRLEGFEPPTNGLEGRRSSSELQAPDRRVARRAALLDELGLGLGVGRVPGAKVEVELKPDAVVPDRREPVDVDRVRPDLVGDVLAFS